MSALSWLWASGAAVHLVWLLFGRMLLHVMGKTKLSGVDTPRRKIQWLILTLKNLLGDSILWPLTVPATLLDMTDPERKIELQRQLSAGDIELNADAPAPLPPEDPVSVELMRVWQAHIDNEVRDSVNIPDLVKFYPLLVSSWALLQRGFPQWNHGLDSPEHAQRMFLEIAEEISDPALTVTSSPSE